MPTIPYASWPGRWQMYCCERFPDRLAVPWRRMAHPLVDQLRITRSEWLRALDGIPEGDGATRLQPIEGAD